jgi:transcriptional regulator of aroF, aroG, tyrA and aromatic amino acid transport
LKNLITSEPCLSKIFIFLSLETQQYLAEFITYGFFHRFKSDHKIFSNVRIICSSNKNLQNLVTDGLFSKALFNELKKTSINFPSLASLSDPEIANLAQGFTEQALKSNTFKNLLSLNEKDKYKLLHEKPVSLHELKTRVQQILINKSNRHHIQDSTEFDPAYNISDPELAQAVRLGKKALKDPQIMIFLWDKFKNQNKIATLLGVNRSSVNRRCKEYNLQ